MPVSGPPAGEGPGETVELVVGRVGRAHGIRGDVTVDVRTDDPDDRLGPGAVLVTQPAERGPLTVDDARWHSGRLLLRFEGVHDRTGAEQLRGTVLVVHVPLDEVPDDPEEYYDHQLVGLQVRRTGGPPGSDRPGEQVLGEVVDVLHLPAQDVLAVRLSADGREVLVPFVEAIVPTVDLAAGYVAIDPPGGLLDAEGA